MTKTFSKIEIHKKQKPKRKLKCIISHENLFASNSNHCGTAVKARIIRDDLLSYICSECNLEPKWNNKPLVLQLDHINGIRNDHRLENLRFLCPNCHT